MKQPLGTLRVSSQSSDAWIFSAPASREAFRKWWTIKHTGWSTLLYRGLVKCIRHDWMLLITVSSPLWEKNCIKSRTNTGMFIFKVTEEDRNYRRQRTQNTQGITDGVWRHVGCEVRSWARVFPWRLKVTAYQVCPPQVLSKVFWKNVHVLILKLSAQNVSLIWWTCWELPLQQDISA